jgi:hypothetical protein
MLWKSKKAKGHYYLLAGMEEGSVRRKRRWMLLWGASWGIIISVLIGVGLYLLNQP